MRSLSNDADGAPFKNKNDRKRQEPDGEALLLVETRSQIENDPWRTAVELGEPRHESRESGKRKLDSLFRREAVDARQQSWLGETLIARPLATSLLTLMAIMMAALIVAFLVFGEYTRKERVVGEVQTSLGLARITPPLNGVVTRRLVE